MYGLVILTGAGFCATSLGLAAQQPILLQRLLTRGVPEVTLVSPKSIAIGNDDRIYIGDESPARVLSFDSTGVFLRIIGREGAGPGEFRSPVVGAGDFLVVNDGQLKRLSAFDATGKLLWTQPGACCRSRPIRVDQTGRIYVVSSPLMIGGGLPLDEMIVFSPDGIPVDTVLVPGFGGRGELKREWRLVSKQAALAAGIPFMPEQSFAITRIGTVVWGHSGAYTLMEGSDAATPRTTIQRPWTAARLSIAERARGREANVGYFARMVDRATLEQTFKLADIPERAPAFFGLDVDSCGRWWVLRTSVYMDPPATFDVFSNLGAPLGTVALAEHLVSDEKWVVGRNKLASIVQDNDGAPTLAVYRIPDLPGCRTG
jgi:hypothetical protein